MKALSMMPPDDARGIVGLLFDLDDTVLSHGVLTREAYDAIWSLHEAGLRLVAVTGRPSGWGEVIVRQWPINGAVTENGSVHIVRDGKAVSVILDGEAAEVADRRSRLDALVADVAKKMPHVKLADDVHARRSDVAWDIAERERLDAAGVVQLGEMVIAAGARTTRSSVHLHATFERDDKASGAIRFVHREFGDDSSAALHRWAFVGDSGNDAACFAAFKTTFGVENVRAYARVLSVPPRWVAPGKRGAGFAQIAKAILSSRW